MTKNTIVFSIELPDRGNQLIDYTSSIRLFFINDPQQSILDHPVLVQQPPPITVDVSPLTTRSIRVLLRHLCLSYIEVKGIVYQNSVTIIDSFVYHHLLLSFFVENHFSSTM